METIKRYSMKMGDMTKDSTTRSILHRSKGVPMRFLDTPSRRAMKNVLRVFGMVFFAMTMMALLGILVGWVMTGIFSYNVESIHVGDAIAALFILNLFNVFGMLAELAGDGGGSNWFARGFILSIIVFGSGFLFCAFWRMFSL